MRNWPGGLGDVTQAGWIWGGGGRRALPGPLPGCPSPHPRAGPRRLGAFPDFPGGGAAAGVESGSLSYRRPRGRLWGLGGRGNGGYTPDLSGGAQVLSVHLPTSLQFCPPSPAPLSLSAACPISICLLVFVCISVSQEASLWDPEIGCGALVPKKGLNPGGEEPQWTEA